MQISGNQDAGKGSSGEHHTGIAITPHRNNCKMPPISALVDHVQRARYNLTTRLLIVLGLILIIRLLVLGLAGTDLFFDEAQYWLWGQEPDFGYFSKPPVLGWIIGAFTRLFGDDSPFVIRMASPIIHTLTAWFIYLTGREIFDEKVGFWSALTYVTLPAVSLSSTLISTDVPLLLFWSIALYGFVRLFRGIIIPTGWLIGAALGLGLMSKYAMIFFVICAALYFVFEDRGMGLRLVTSKAFIIICGLAFLIVLPNIHWNLTHGLATLSHTAANANWGRSMFHPGKLVEFFGAQFGVFGPVLFGALMVILWRHMRGEKNARTRLLLWFTIPVIVIIMFQAFLSRAHANWAATAYPAATILVTAEFIRRGPWRLYLASLVLHLLVFAGISLGAIQAAHLALPIRADPYYRVLGWQNLADDVRKRLKADEYGAVLTHRRVIAAELIYYLRDLDIPVKMWMAGQAPHNHYEMTRPFRGATAKPVLYVTDKRPLTGLLARFEEAKLIARVDLPASAKRTRRITYYRLSGFRQRK